MEAAIVVVWWIALNGALVLTVIAVSEIVRVLHYAREINRLAKRALLAGQGIADNTAAIADLEGIGQTAGRLLGAVETLDRTAAAIEGRVGALRRALRMRAIGGA